MHTHDAPLLAVASKLLTVDYFVEEIRLKGGAYGAGCGHNGMEHTFKMHSYRDPNIKNTLDVFNGLIDYVHNANWTQSEIEEGIIGTAKLGEKPIRPESATGIALWRHYMAETKEFREDWHRRVLASTPTEVKRAMSDLLEENFSSGGLCVLSSQEKLETANKELGESPLIIEEVFEK